MVEEILCCVSKSTLVINVMMLRICLFDLFIADLNIFRNKKLLMSTLNGSK